MKSPWFLLLCLLLVPGAAAAYDVASPSGTNQATGNLFREPKDGYVSPLYFTELAGPVLFLSFDTPQVSTPSVFQIGGGMPLFGAYYAGLHYIGANSVVGKAGSSQSTAQSVADTLLVNTGGQIVGKSRTVTTTTDYQTQRANDLCALLGMRLDAMDVGVFLQSVYNDSSEYGTWDPSTFSSTPAIASSSVTTVTDAAGAAVSATGTEYGLGSSTASLWKENLVGGVRVDMGGGVFLLATAGLTFSMNGSARTGSSEMKTVQANAGYAAYTPATALPGNTAAAIADCKSYGFTDANIDQGSFLLAPSLSGNVQMPLSFLPYSPVLTAGLGYAFRWTLYSASYRDTAGAAATVLGTAGDSYSQSYSTAMNGTWVSTTNAVTRYFAADATADFTHALEPVCRVVFAPDPHFSFGLSYEPLFEFYGDSHGVSSGYVTTTTYQDGDGLDGNATAGADPDDYVQVRTVTYAPYTRTTDRFTWKNVLKTGAKFFLVPERFRVNLGAEVSDVALERKTVTTTYTGVQTDQTTRATNGGTAVVTAYDVTEALGTSSRTTFDVGLSPTAAYEAGFTFFFSDAMFLDFLMDYNGGDIWNTSQYSLEMTIRFPPAASEGPASGVKEEQK